MGGIAGVEKVRDRVVELRRVKANRLRRHPRNWRVHTTEQRRALHDVLHDVGWSGALLARELPDGELELIDGHLRAETCGEQEVPVLVLDVDEAEADRLLATFDPLGMMAGHDARQLDSLLERIGQEHRAIGELVQRWADGPTAHPDLPGAAASGVNRTAPSGIDGAWHEVADDCATNDMRGGGKKSGEARLQTTADGPVESYQVVVDCENEARQKELFERLSREGWQCRLLML